MPFPCCAQPFPLPCSAAKGLDLSFPYYLHSAGGRVWFTHAMPRPCRARAIPRPCRSESDFSRSRHSAVWAHNMNGMACVNYHRPSRDGMWATCPRSASSGYHAEFHEGYQKHTNPLKCRTSSPDISGYHTDFHEGHGTVGEWQGHSMACVN
jgi:hypothetical protein